MHRIVFYCKVWDNSVEENLHVKSESCKCPNSYLCFFTQIIRGFIWVSLLTGSPSTFLPLLNMSKFLLLKFPGFFSKCMLKLFSRSINKSSPKSASVVSSLHLKKKSVLYKSTFKDKLREIIRLDFVFLQRPFCGPLEVSAEAYFESQFKITFETVY